MTHPPPNRTFLKTKLFAHLETMRPYTFLWCGLVSLVGACLTYGDLPSARTAVLAFFIPLFGWIAGLYLADYQDRELDSIQKPHRPIPSGRIPPDEALIVGAIFAFAGLFLSFFLTVNNVLLVFVVAVLVFFYVKFSKARGIFGNINRGAVIFIAYLFGVFSIPVNLSSIPLYIWVLAIVFILHDTSSNLIGAIRDIEGDRQGGYQTIPVKYGMKRSLLISLVLCVSYILLISGLVLWYGFFRYPLLFAGTFLIGIFLLCVMFFMMFRSLAVFNRRRALRAHELFIAERIILASAFLLGIIDSQLVSFSILILALVITLSIQYFIRGRYEFMEKI